MLKAPTLKRGIMASLLSSAVLLVVVSQNTSAPNSSEIRAPSTFAGIADTQARSRALFTEAAKVIMSPRCMNCHPAGDRPTQGNDMHAHVPQVTRGDGGLGV